MRLFTHCLLLTIIPIAISCTANPEVATSILSPEEIDFWAIYKFSDQLYLEFTADDPPEEYAVDIYFPDDVSLRKLIDYPWYKRIPVCEDSLGRLVSLTIDHATLSSLLGSDDVWLVKLRNTIPGMWVRGHKKRVTPDYTRWINSKIGIYYFHDRNARDRLSLDEMNDPLHSIMRHSMRYLGPGTRSGDIVYHDVPIDAPLRFRIRTFFTHRITKDDSLFQYRSGLNSIDKILDLDEFVQLAQRVDVACFFYILWSTDLPAHLQVEYNGVPEYWDQEDWRKVDRVLLERMLYHNYLQNDSTKSSVVFTGGRRFPVRLKHYLDSDPWLDGYRDRHIRPRTKEIMKYTGYDQYDHWITSIVGSMIREIEPSSLGMDIDPAYPFRPDPIVTIPPAIKRCKKDYGWTEIDSSTVEVRLTYKEISRMIASPALISIEYIGE